MSGEGHRTHGPDGLARIDAGEQPGGTIGRYVVVSRLGEGAMGMVYLAYDPQLDRRLALKVLRRRLRSSRSAEERKQRLRREARAMAQLNHPHVVTVHDVGVADGRVFLAMDYVPGQDLREWLEVQRHPWRKVLRTFIYAGRGLAAAHAAGVIHRDFKPENVLVGEDGSVKVMDFGLARPCADRSRSSGVSDTREVSADRLAERAPTARTVPVGSEPEPGERAERSPCEPNSADDDPYPAIPEDIQPSMVLTRSGDVLGTPSYMAPELFQGGEADAQTDQFAFCVALYEGLYGVRPFAGESMAALAFNMHRERITPPPRNSRVPAWLGRLVRRGLALRPDRRYPSVEALLEALIEGAARQRLQRAGVLGLGLVLAGGGLSYALVPSPTPCRAGQERLAEVWNEERSAAIAAAFESTAVPYADEVLARARERLDDYAESWVGVYTQVCEATAVHKHQTPAELDRRIACLDDRLAELDALLQVLGEADRRVAERAAQAASDLRGPGTCAAESLAPDPEATSPDYQRQVDILRGRLLRAEALENGGRYEDAASLSREIAVEAELLGEVRLHAEALVQLGAADDMGGDYEAAALHLRKAYFVANEAGLDDVAAQAAVDMIRAEAVRLHHRDEGLAWARHAEVALDRSNASDVLWGRYHAAMGALYLEGFELDSAREHYDEALAIARKTRGEDHEDVASLLAYRAFVQEQAGRSEDAMKSFDKALEITRRALGPKHPALATLHNNYAVVLFGRQDLQRSQEQLEKALVIQRAALGEHPATATFIDNLGVLIVARGDLERGRVLLEEALAMRERIFGSDHYALAHSLANLADVLRLEGDLGGAQRDYERALGILEKGEDPGTPHRGRMLASLGMLALFEGAIQRGHDQCQRAVQMIDPLVGDQHVVLVEPLTCLGWSLLELEQPEQALAPLERAYGMVELAQVDFPALVRVLLARALTEVEGDAERATRLRAEAREIYAQGIYEPPERVAAWLDDPPNDPPNDPK